MTIESSTAVPALTFITTLIWPAIPAGGTGAGNCVPVAAVRLTAEIDTDGGTVADAAFTTTEAQPFLFVSTEEVAQTATPGVAATAVATPVALTDTFEPSLDAQVTAVPAPFDTSTTAENETVWPTAITAVAGATDTLLTLAAGVVVSGPTTLTLSPQAAAKIATAATKVERRTFMPTSME